MLLFIIHQQSCGKSVSISRTKCIPIPIHPPSQPATPPTNQSPHTSHSLTNALAKSISKKPFKISESENGPEFGSNLVNLRGTTATIICCRPPAVARTASTTTTTKKLNTTAPVVPNTRKSKSTVATHLSCPLSCEEDVVKRNEQRFR